MRLLLQSAGYQVIAAASLAEALPRATPGVPIALLITDYHLDSEFGALGISAVRQQLHRILKAVLMTGDICSTIAELPPDPLTRSASKPFDPEALLGLTRTLLADS